MVSEACPIGEQEPAYKSRQRKFSLRPRSEGIEGEVYGPGIWGAGRGEVGSSHGRGKYLR